MNFLKTGNKAFIEKQYDQAYKAYQDALIFMPELANIINFNIELLSRRRYRLRNYYNESEKKNFEKKLQKPLTKLPITALVISWDIGHNCLGRSYMLAEVIQRVCRTTLLVGFQFPKFGTSIWEPVKNGNLPVVNLPGSNFPEFLESIEKIGLRIKPDIIFACKPRLPSVALGMVIKEKWGCPMIIDVDDHELTFFRNRDEVTIDDLTSMPFGFASNELEPYGELWTRLTQSLCKKADGIIVSNRELKKEFGGVIIPHVRDENNFDPSKYDKKASRIKYAIPVASEIVMFFGTPHLHKGIETLALAVQKIENPNVKLLLVGATADTKVASRLEQLAPGRIIFLGKQPFSAIPEILVMADVICLPQDNQHPISQFQLPAKAIDAIAMGIPLLVSETPPLRQLVEDGVAEAASTEQLPAAISRILRDVSRFDQKNEQLRNSFLKKYSYESASGQIKDLILKCLNNQKIRHPPNTQTLINASRHSLGINDIRSKKMCKSGVDIVIFWKQNDTGLYGRRHDMVIQYLASRPDIRKVIVFDTPISEYTLNEKLKPTGEFNQHRLIYISTYQKYLGVKDTEKISYNVFIHKPGIYSTSDSDTNKPHLISGYIPYIVETFLREQVNPSESIFWIYPKNYLAPELIKYFQPYKVVIDVVDDHRSWPDITEVESDQLTMNYKELLWLADLAFANCENVYRSMKQFFPPIRLVPNGCDPRLLHNVTWPPKKSVSTIESERKKIMFIGNLESKIDIELIEKLAQRFRECDVILIGSTHSNPKILRLQSQDNVRFVGVIRYIEIGEWLSQAAVGIIPHLKNDLTDSMNPLKLYVYLSAGVPVVSTEINGIDSSSGAVSIARNHEEFLDLIADTLENPRIDYDALRNYIFSNSWESRLKSEIDALIEIQAEPKVSGLNRDQVSL